MQIVEGVSHFLWDFVKMFRSFAENLFFHIFLELPQDLGAILQCVLDIDFHWGWQIIQIVSEGWSRADAEEWERQQV